MQVNIFTLINILFKTIKRKTENILFAILKKLLQLFINASHPYLYMYGLTKNNLLIKFIGKERF